MKKDLDRRGFLKIAGASMGVGALYTVWPGLGSADGAEVARRLGLKNGEKPTPFTFAQLSDAHVGFDGPIGTSALEKAVENINSMPQTRTSSCSPGTSPMTPKSRASTRRA